MWGLGELLLPRRCAGCGRPQAVLCEDCRRVWQQPPQRISTRVVAPAPIWALGPFGGARRQLILALKERGRRDVLPSVGAVLRASVEHLIAAGELDEDVVLVPAPTRRSAARARGGCTVSGACELSGFPMCASLWFAESVQDSARLDASQRLRNVRDGLRVGAVPDRPVLVVDDVVTTGATLVSSMYALTSAGVKVRGALGWACA